MNLKIKGSNELIEGQFRDTEIDIFAELEHIPYDISENKLTVRGEKYNELRNVLSNLNSDGAKLYEKYRSDVYTYYRLKALGVKNCQKPDIAKMFLHEQLLGKKLFKDGVTFSSPQEKIRQIQLLSEDGLRILHES